MSKAILNGVTSILCETFESMFDYRCMFKLEDFQSQVFPGMDDFMVFVPIREKSGRECHLLLGFPSQLVMNLVANILDFHSESSEHHKLMESVVSEIGNVVANRLSVEDSIVEVIGKSTVSVPKVCALLEENEMTIPFEIGEKGYVKVGEYKVDIFIGFSADNELAVVDEDETSSY